MHTAGLFDIGVFATDSRGLTSAIIYREFMVLPYTPPRNTITMSRHNGFEKDIFLNLQSVYSQLSVNEVIKNNDFSIRYRIQEVGEDWGPYISILDFTTEETSSSEITATYIRNTVENAFLELDNANDYNLQFYISDRLSKVYNTINIPAGIPFVFEGQEGRVSFGMIPDWESPAKLQSGTDILATDI